MTLYQPVFCMEKLKVLPYKNILSILSPPYRQTRYCRIQLWCGSTECRTHTHRVHVLFGSNSYRVIGIGNNYIGTQQYNYISIQQYMLLVRGHILIPYLPTISVQGLYEYYWVPLEASDPNPQERPNNLNDSEIKSLHGFVGVVILTARSHEYVTQKNILVPY